MKKSLNRIFIYLFFSLSVICACCLFQIKKLNNNGTFIFAEELQTADYRVLKVDGSKTTALIGSTFTIPTAKFVLGSTETTLTGSNIKVTSPIGEEVEIVNGKFTVERIGKYSITYTYTEGLGEDAKTYSAVYTVEGQVSENEIIEKNTTTGTTIETQPKFSKLPDAINEGKLELGESVELPIPTLPSDEYEYHINVKGGLAFANKERFTPKKAGTYTIEYTMNKVGETAVLDTKQFVIKVEDTTKPEIFVDWNLNASYDKDSKVLIPVFSANDVSGIDMEESKIVISSKSYSRTIKASEMANELKKYNEHLEDNSKDAGNLYVTLRYNEEYTVTYTAYDKSSNKNVTTVSYSIKVGDMVAPTIDLDDNIIPSKVKVNDKLTIDVSKITITDSKGDVIPTSELKIVVKNTTTGTTIKNNFEDEEGKFEYTITSAGEYTVTFSAEKNGNKREVVRTFTVNEQEIGGNYFTEQELTLIYTIKKYKFRYSINKDDYLVIDASIFHDKYPIVSDKIEKYCRFVIVNSKYKNFESLLKNGKLLEEILNNDMYNDFYDNYYVLNYNNEDESFRCRKLQQYGKYDMYMIVDTGDVSFDVIKMSTQINYINTPLVLGLSLGIGIPAMLAGCGIGIYFYVKKRRLIVLK